MSCSIILCIAANYSYTSYIRNIVSKRFTVDCVYISLKSDSNSLFTGEVAAIIVVLTFIITITTIVIFVMTYIVLKKKFGFEVKPNSEQPKEKALCELVDLPNKMISEVNLELEPNSAYVTSHNLTMNTNPAYESCK